MKILATSVLSICSVANHVVSQKIRFINQHSQGWFDSASPIVLGLRSYWISGEAFTTYHLKKGAELVTSNLLNTSAQLKKGKDYIKDRKEGFFIPQNGYTTKHFTCGKEERCEMLLYLQSNKQWIPQYSKTNQKPEEDYFNVIRPDSGGLIISHVFEGPSTRTLWVKQLYWCATGIAKHFSIIRHIGGFSSTNINITIPLTLPNGDPDIIFGYSEY